MTDFDIIPSILFADAVTVLRNTTGLEVSDQLRVSQRADGTPYHLVKHLESGEEVVIARLLDGNAWCWRTAGMKNAVTTGCEATFGAIAKALERRLWCPYAEAYEVDGSRSDGGEGPLP